MIHPRVIDVIRRVTGNPDLTVESINDPFMVLGWDSLKAVEILLEIQDYFGITITPDEILHLKNAVDLQKLIDDKQKNGVDAP